jgi:hypothetical protein
VKCDASCFKRSFAPTMMIQVVRTGQMLSMEETCVPTNNGSVPNKNEATNAQVRSRSGAFGLKSVGKPDINAG